MSLDYGNPQLVRGHLIQATVANATTELDRFFSKSFAYLVLHAQLIIKTAATTDRSHTFKVQMAGSDNTFSSPTDLCSLAIATTDAAGAEKEDRCTAIEAQVPAGRQCRVVHVANGTDASLDYYWQVATSSLHE